MIDLYHNDMSTCAQKVRCQFAYKGLDWTSHALNLRAGDQHQPTFLALNPKGVVPVVVHDGTVVTESNIIMEYVEDAFPDLPSLRADTAAGNARMRNWMQRLDTQLHLDIAVLSIGVAFRDQLMAVHDTPEKLEAYYAAMPDLRLRKVYQNLVPQGPASSEFGSSLKAWQKSLKDAERALENRDFLAVDSITLADLAVLPYVLRLEHLQLSHLWSELPRTAAWYERMKATPAYAVGIQNWLNPKYLELMKEKGSQLELRAYALD